YRLTTNVMLSQLMLVISRCNSPRRACDGQEELTEGECEGESMSRHQRPVGSVGGRPRGSVWNRFAQPVHALSVHIRDNHSSPSSMHTFATLKLENVSKSLGLALRPVQYFFGGHRNDATFCGF